MRITPSIQPKALKRAFKLAALMACLKAGPDTYLRTMKSQTHELRGPRNYRAVGFGSTCTKIPDS
jgi:hypothetical protein